eukprot:967014-Pyramimonas_sp.AAC.1
MSFARICDAAIKPLLSHSTTGDINAPPNFSRTPHVRGVPSPKSPPSEGEGGGAGRDRRDALRGGQPGPVAAVGS